MVKNKIKNILNGQYILVLFIFSILIIISGCKKNPVTPPDNSGVDTTSHNFVWQADTLGVYPSYLQSVWGTDANNVYAVGLIIYSYSPYKFTAIVHWDGAKWTSMDYEEGWLNSIYGFGKNDIWAVGYWQVDYNRYALITHWDGKSWTTWKLQQYKVLSAVWGTSSSNLYAVGEAGLVLHYNGTNWTQQQSRTELSIVDIWGVDNSHIFASGLQGSTASGILLESDGHLWNTIMKGVINPDSSTLYGEFESVWGNSSDKLILVGSLCYEGTTENWKLSDIPYNSPGNNIVGLTAMNHVRGDASNNIFICGDRDLIIHWNGKSWNIYYQFFDKTKQSSLDGVWVKDKSVFIVGYENSLSQAIIYRGVQ
jgi:hypothetical protein